MEEGDPDDGELANVAQAQKRNAFQVNRLRQQQMALVRRNIRGCSSAIGAICAIDEVPQALAFEARDRSQLDDPGL
jgi:hypothetical protein